MKYLPLLLSLCLGWAVEAVAADTDYKIAEKLIAQAGFGKIPRKPASDIHLVFMPPTTQYSFYRAVGGAIQDYCDEVGMECNRVAPQVDSPIIQYKLMESIIDQDNVDAIVFASHDSKLIAPLIRRAVDRGIATIIYNSDQTDFDTPIHAVVGVSMRKANRTIGGYAAQFVKPGQTIGIIEGPPSYISDERVNGFLEGLLAKVSNPIVVRANGQWTADGAYFVALDMLKAHPDIDLIYSANDYEAIGVRAAADAFGKSSMKVLGYDGENAGLEAVARGVIDATSSIGPRLQGRIAARIVVDIFSGSFTGGRVELEPQFVTKDTVTDLYWAETMAPRKLVVADEDINPRPKSGSATLSASIIRMIYGARGFDVSVLNVPYARGLIMLKQGDADLLLGTVPGGETSLACPQWPYAVDTISILHNKALTGWSGVESIFGQPVGIMRLSKLETFLPFRFDRVDLNTHSGMVYMVNAGRLKYAMDLRSEIDKVLATPTLPISGDLVVTDLFPVKMYACAQDTAAGRMLAEIFDEEYPKLIHSEELRHIYEARNLKPWFAR